LAYRIVYAVKIRRVRQAAKEAEKEVRRQRMAEQQTRKAVDNEEK